MPNHRIRSRHLSVVYATDGTKKALALRFGDLPIASDDQRPMQNTRGTISRSTKRGIKMLCSRDITRLRLLTDVGGSPRYSAPQSHCLILWEFCCDPVSSLGEYD